ncbi:hypothetical protein J7E88_34645 [Streptomyces sp. ISL-10]|uniref:hypothetical protein n=1 Tax=Streptomyces sp. ISL-10 TaxID=2819172 RepID=UPI001BECF582|nr:hypothetical protein [Streptomyces sp. ISL-10]MBT2370276.1 hypothetical protein [Streptomyces sp. ISL-10]
MIGRRGVVMAGVPFTVVRDGLVVGVTGRGGLVDNGGHRGGRPGVYMACGALPADTVRVPQREE